MAGLNEELETLNARARELEDTIAKNAAEILVLRPIVKALP